MDCPSLRSTRKFKVFELPSSAPDSPISRVDILYVKINGRLVQGFIYQSQLQVAAELDGNNRIVRRFVYGEKPVTPDYIIEGGRSLRLVSNQVGTPILLVNSSSGKIEQRFSFDEFGNPTSSEEVASHERVLPFGFAGGIYDRDTGLVRMGARDYDSETGRWLSKDPILFKGRDTNLYGYTFNDPINFIDPSGLIFHETIAQYTTARQQAALGAAAAAAGAGLLRYAFTIPNPLAAAGAAGMGAFLALEGGANLNYVRTNRGGEFMDFLDFDQVNRNRNRCETPAGL